MLFGPDERASIQDTFPLPPDSSSSSARLKFIGTGLCALLVHLISAQSTLASCGDWLANHSDSAEPVAASHPDHVYSIHHVESKNRKPQKRCEGPFCQNAPIPVTPSSPPVPPTPESQQWLQLCDDVNRVDVDRRSPTLPQSEPSPESAFPRRLDRPPCL